ncbi:hypothetical protein [Gracilibacillus sp. JCM 18860]|uniref:hypothetical protein n=1 Tax=Gracilibacillus sp. JCM 18860 TaxID=1306159 RepID=UPI0006D2BF7E
MRKLKTLFIISALLAIVFTVIVSIVIVTDTDEKQKAQGNQEDSLQNQLSSEKEGQKVKEKNKTNDKIEVDLEKIGLDKEVNPFPNDSFPHAGLSDERFEEYLTLMENDDKEITKERLEWLIEGLDFVGEESRPGFKERINSLEDKVQ